MKYSKHQIRFFKEIEETNNHILLNAVAGSGKTTTIVHSLEKLPPGKDIIFLAFNNSIVKELRKRCPERVEVSTMHSYGCKVLMRHFGKLKVVEDKVYGICLKLFSSWNIENEPKTSYCWRVAKLADMARLTLCDLDEESLFQLSIKYGIPVFNSELEKVPEVLKISNSQAFERIDFTDMIYQFATKNLKSKRYDYVYIDELQDLNACQHKIIDKLLKPTGRFIGVGDRNQSIYAFAGADEESFDKMKTRYASTVELPLSISYRCPIEVVNHAKLLVPQIESSPTAEKGCVRYGSWKELKQGDWVLCRNTKPLVKLLMLLVRDNKKAYIKGREIGQNLINIIERSRQTTVNALLEHLNENKKELKNKLLSKRVYRPDSHPQFVEFQEKIDIIRMISVNIVSTKILVKKIESIFLDEDIPAIILSTIHKSKGLEAERIFVFCPELIPSQFARTAKELSQEDNLKYVMITRAKKELVYVDDFTVDMLKQL